MFEICVLSYMHLIATLGVYLIYQANMFASNVKKELCHVI